MTVWNVQAFREFMSCSHKERSEQGFLVASGDALHVESLRFLLEFPHKTLNAPVVLLQDDQVLGDDAQIDLSADEPCIDLMRDATDGRIAGGRADLSHKNVQSFENCRDQVLGIMDSLFDFSKLSLKAGSDSVATADSLITRFSDISPTDQLRFLMHAAETIYCAPFENYSKVFSGVAFRSGVEMLENISYGFGGICAEKNGCFRFICDILGLDTFVIAGSTETMDEQVLAATEAFINNGGEGRSPAWYQHLITGVIVDGERFLVDTTNGNIPFMFLDESDTQEVLEAGVRARMVYQRERLNLIELPRHLGDAIFLINEYHLPNQCDEFIFKQGLGLNITHSLFIGAYFDWGGERSRNMQLYYSARARALHLPFPYFIHESNIAAIPDDNLRELLEKTGVALRLKHARPEYTGGFTFVIQPLFSDRWRRPRISQGLLKRIGKDI